MHEVQDENFMSQAAFTGNEVLIIGAGHFGKRAADVLSPRLGTPLWVVEKDEEALRVMGGLPIARILHEAVPFLAGSFHLLHPKNVIVPAVPIHLAFEWLRRSMKGNFSVFRIEVPESIKPLLPHTWVGGEGSLLVSYADFQCPDDCPEPADHCTVTGQRRGIPLHALLSDIDLPGYRVHVLRSRQLAPGVGGYTVGDLQELLGRVESGGEGKWLVATACKCHGVVSAMEMTIQKSRTLR
jgi:hypothetical protein